MPKNKSNKIKSKVSKKNIRNKIIVFSLIGMIVLSTVGGVVANITNFNASSSTKTNYESYTKDVDLALNKSTGIEHGLIDKVVEKQNKNDYSLNSILEILGTPIYIAEGSKVISNEKQIEKLLKNYKNQKYNETEKLTELAWKTKDNNLVMTYLATDIKDKSIVVGLSVTDLSLNTNSIVKNDKLKEIDKNFEDFADVKLTLNEFEKKIGKLQPYSIQYPLYYKSEVVKAFSSEEDAKSTMSQKLIRTKNSTIVVYSRNNDIVSLNEILDPQAQISQINKNKQSSFNEAKNNTKLKENEFKSEFKQARLITMEESIGNDNKEVLKTNYIIKDYQGNLYTVTFNDGKVVLFEAKNENADIEK